MFIKIQAKTITPSVERKGQYVNHYNVILIQVCIISTVQRLPEVSSNGPDLYNYIRVHQIYQRAREHHCVRMCVLHVRVSTCSRVKRLCGGRPITENQMCSSPRFLRVAWLNRCENSSIWSCPDTVSNRSTYMRTHTCYDIMFVWNKMLVHVLKVILLIND